MEEAVSVDLRALPPPFRQPKSGRSGAGDPAVGRLRAVPYDMKLADRPSLGTLEMMGDRAQLYQPHHPQLSPR
jgi:hypothetical protein